MGVMLNTQGEPRDGAISRGFYYSRQQMSRAAVDLGWTSTFIGDWDHPANSMMMKYEAI
jgi:hypothetical protein